MKNLNNSMKIICLTEETVETLYLLGKEDCILGVSEYVERPPEAKKLPVVSQFIRGDIEKIVSLKSDLIVGFSDLQKDIARELIGRGQNVLVTNQRSLDEILQTMEMIGRIVGEEDKVIQLTDSFRDKVKRIQQISSRFEYRPKVYFEEWDSPRYSCIKWVSELIEICGGRNIFQDKVGSFAREREVTDEQVQELNPDLILGCWCGKKVKLDSFYKRYPNVKAVKNHQVFEFPPSVFLQPGPALFLDGLDLMLEKIKDALTLTKSKSGAY